jgi:hypothetical protein
MSRPARVSLACVVALGVTTISVACLSRFTIGSVWDDSYIVGRYADNWLKTGRLSWNPGDAPTYGFTSPLYLAAVIPLRAIASSEALALALSSLLSGLLAFGLLSILGRAIAHGGSHKAGIALAWLVFAFGSSAGSLATHLLSGMDTMFAVAFLAAFLVLLEGRHRPDARLVGPRAAILGGLAFMARPDLLLFTLAVLAVPAVLVSLPGARGGRRRAWTDLGIALLTLAAQLLLTSAYFHSALPLPFYAKGLHLYGDSIYETYAGVAIAQLIAFGKSYGYFLLPVGVEILLGPTSWWQRTSALEKGVLGGSVLFIAYHALFVLPIMFYAQRFYYPALPALFYLAVRASCRLADDWSRARPRLLLASGTLCTGIGLVGLVKSGVSEWQQWRFPKTQQTLGHFSVSENYRAGAPSAVWRGLDGIAALPDDLVVATTEVGYPAAMNPTKRIIDLAGLNNTDIALGRVSPQGLLRTVLPDVIYLPHPDYREMNRAIRTEPDLLSRYEMFQGYPSPPALDVALLRASRHYSELRRFIEPRSGVP